MSTMSAKLVISGVHMKVDDDLTKYITKKIAKLDKYIPRQARGSAHVEVKVSTNKIDGKRASTCEATIHLPGEDIRVVETTVNMFAAVDIIEVRLKNMLKRYKYQSYSDNHRVRRLVARLRMRPS